MKREGGYVVCVRCEVDIWVCAVRCICKGKKRGAFYGPGIGQKEELREGEEDW